jgi:hypothetical protein
MPTVVAPVPSRARLVPVAVLTGALVAGLPPAGRVVVRGFRSGNCRRGQRGGLGGACLVHLHADVERR